MKSTTSKTLSELLVGSESELGDRIRDRLASRRPVSEMGPPILICGCGHSGTTLLLSVLSAHPNLLGVPFESSFVRRDIDADRDFRDFFELLCHLEGRKRWVEKTPMHVHFVPKLLDVHPDSRVLVCLRDGRDVACSIRNRHGDFGMGVARWVKDNRSSEPSWAHPRVQVVRYEDLVSDFEGTLRTIARFVGEAWVPELVNYHRDPPAYYGGVARQSLSQVVRALVETRPEKKGPAEQSGPNNFEYRYWQMSQPVFDGRGIWKEQMSVREKLIFKAVAGADLIRHGYAGDLDW